jgi:hypothetical protein
MTNWRPLLKQIKLGFGQMKIQLLRGNGDTLKFDRIKQRTTWGLALLGQDVVIFISSNMAAFVRAGQTSVSICRLSCTFVFQSAAVPGGRFSNPPTTPSPVLCLQAFDDTIQISIGF